MNMNDYQEATEFLFTQLPVFQRSGASAYKPGLDTARALSAAFGNPHKGLRCIHVAGTNGKGSTAHTLAAVLQSAGYRTGLYTSPHLADFRERIRVNGKMISREEVVDFTRRYRAMSDLPAPSFFELTTVMAFEHFRRMEVDVAVIETGLGGRLDTTNIIEPDLCVITNISLDHTALLGDTPELIAGEKAGIIKPGVPVVIGEAEGTVRRVFEDAAQRAGAPIRFVPDSMDRTSVSRDASGTWVFGTPQWGKVSYELTGDCQRHNGLTELAAIDELVKAGYEIGAEHVREGMAHVCELTGLAGRWMVLGTNPLRVCDTGHNVGGWEYLSAQIATLPGTCHIVLGFVNDKDVSSILGMISRIPSTRFYFVKASVDRALPADELAALAAEAGITGTVAGTVTEGYEKALACAGEGDSVFVGGSTFVVADLLAYLFT